MSRSGCILFVIQIVNIAQLATCFNLTILHTNDLHSAFEQFNAYNLPCSEDDIERKTCFGGVARRATVVKEIRRENKGVLLLDAGDAFQGSAWFNVYGGAAASYFMNLLQYDAMAIGNHELDKGVAGFVPFLKAVNFPVLSCNIDATDEPSIDGLFKSSVVKKVGAESIGIIGYTTARAPVLTKTGNLKFEDEAQALQREVNLLIDQGIDKIIAVGHSGYGVDLDIAKKVNGIDVIVGGHTETFLYTGTPPSTEIPSGPYPTVVSSEENPEHKTLVVSDYSHGKYLGFLQVTFDRDGVISHYQGNPILLDSSIKEDKDTLAEIEKMRIPVLMYLPEVIGESYVLLIGSDDICNIEECSPGNLIADALIWAGLPYKGEDGWSDTSVALVNSGGVRNSLNTGNIIERDVKAMYPFEDHLVKMDLLGRHLMETLEHGVSVLGTFYQVGEFLQVSGLIVTYDMSKRPGQRVVSVLVRCSSCLEPDYEPLDPEQTYRVIVPSFISSGGDGFKVLVENGLNVIDTGISTSSAIINYITQRSPIIQGKERRLTLINVPKESFLKGI